MPAVPTAGAPASSEALTDDIASPLGFLLRRVRIRAGELAATEPARTTRGGAASGSAEVNWTGSPAWSETLRHWSVLAVLGERAPVSQQWLADYLRINRSVMVKVIDALESSGLVARTRNSRDRRSYALELTEQGERQAATLAARAKTVGDELTAAVSRQEAELLVELLARVVGPAFDPPIPRALRESLAWLVTTALDLLESRGDASLQPFGLTVRSYVSLAFVAGRACSQSELASRLSIGPAATVDLVDVLEQRGLVRRVRNRHDRRSYALEVTPEGDRLERAARRVARAESKSFTRGLNETEDRELLDLLIRLAASPAITTGHRKASNPK